MNLLVLGNGFDLAHGMPTQYSEFLCFMGLCIKKFNLYPNKSRYSNSETFRIFDLNNVTDCLSSFQKNNNLLYSKLETILNENIEDSSENTKDIFNIIKNNVWLRYFFYSYNKLLSCGTGWIDLENELSSIIQFIDSTAENPAIFSKWILFNNCCLTNIPTLLLKAPPRTDTLFSDPLSYYSFIDSNIFRKQQSINIYPKDDLSSIIHDPIRYIHLTKKFYSYLYDELKNISFLLKYYLENIDTTTPEKKYDFYKMHPNKIDALLNFNYTDTFFKIYYDPFISDFINGRIPDNNIILGIENPNPDAFNHYCDTGIYKFFKYYQRVDNIFQPQYSNWLQTPASYTWEINKIDPSATAHNLNIFVIGHSLDICDKQILEKVILAAENVTIFYYCETDRQDKIVKLSKLLGEKQFIESVNDPTGSPYIIFKDLKEIELPS